MSENSDEHDDVRYDDNLLDPYYGELDAFDLDSAYFGEFVRAEKAERIAKVLMDPHTTPKIIRLYLKNTYIGDYGAIVIAEALKINSKNLCWPITESEMMVLLPLPRH